MASPRKPVKKSTTRPETIDNALSLLRDELRSVGDLVRGLENEVLLLKFSMPSKGDIDTVKAELRLIRSDVASLAKKLSPSAETPVSA
jgi:hypothetical protein